jgi:hypothetical protein
MLYKPITPDRILSNLKLVYLYKRWIQPRNNLVIDLNVQYLLPQTATFTLMTLLDSKNLQ